MEGEGCRGMGVLRRGFSGFMSGLFYDGIVI